MKSTYFGSIRVGGGGEGTWLSVGGVWMVPGDVTSEIMR